MLKKYKYQDVRFYPARLGDADGDALTSTWKLDGGSFAKDSVWEATTGRHVMVLIQDDGKNLPNSVDSTIREFSVLPPPRLDVVFPSAFVNGFQLNFDDLGLAEGLYSRGRSGAEDSRTWTANIDARAAIELIWKPADRIENQKTYNVAVYDTLTFTTQIRQGQAEDFNPANPVRLINAPIVNRPDGHALIFRWYKGNDLVSVGQTAQLPVTRGENTFRVVVEERGVEGSVGTSQTFTLTFQ